MSDYLEVAGDVWYPGQVEARLNRVYSLYEHAMIAAISIAYVVTSLTFGSYILILLVILGRPLVWWICTTKYVTIRPDRVELNL